MAVDVRSGIVGREHERAAIAAFLESSAHAPRALALEGDAGVGKTTLWLDGVERARALGHVVLESRPVAAEARLAFAAVGDLLEGVPPDAIEQIPALQADALRVAMLLERPSRPPPDERAIGVSLLSTMRVLCRSRPVLLAVDDVQWLDAASAAVLTFAWRRLRSEPAKLLLARRATERQHDALVGADRLQRIEVGPLSLGAVHRLLHDRLGLVLARPMLRRVYEATAGNPFFALQLGDALTRRGHKAAAAGPLPIPDNLRQLVRERVAALPAPTRAALAAVAALSSPSVSLVAAVAGGSAHLAPALESGVLERRDDRLRFSHPLLAAAAYEELDARRKCDLHRRLAALVDDDEERARHHALASERADEHVAAALERAAGHARRRGASASAGELCELAGQLTPRSDGPALHRRIVHAARHHFASGDTERARVLLDDALARSTGPRRAEALTVLSLVRLYEGEPQLAAELSRKALEETGASEGVRAEAAMCLATALLFLREELELARQHAALAAELAARAGNVPLHANSLGTQALLECQLGRAEAGLTLQAAIALGEARADTRVLAWPAYHRAAFLLWTDAADAAAPILTRLFDEASTRGDESAMPVILAYIALADYLAGRWPGAARTADEAHDLALQTGQRSYQALALSERALIRAALGQDRAARADAEQALNLAGERGMAVATIHGAWAIALLELSLDRPAEAVRVLTPLRERLLAAGVAEPGALRFMSDEIEAHLALGRPDVAEPLLGWLEERGRTLRRPSALAAAGRCRGLLAAAHGQTDVALAAFERALAAHARVTMPFEHARTLLARGATCRRVKQRSAARDALAQALTGFERLGAANWAERTRGEIARIGGRSPSRAGLTPTQWRVAQLASEGRSNKEIAAALYVTPKTVETQLSRIYGKLGVHSRTALAHRLRRDDERKL